MVGPLHVTPDFSTRRVGTTPWADPAGDFASSLLKSSLLNPPHERFWPDALPKLRSENRSYAERTRTVATRCWFEVSARWLLVSSAVRRARPPGKWETITSTSLIVRSREFVPS